MMMLYYLLIVQRFIADTWWANCFASNETTLYEKTVCDNCPFFICVIFKSYFAVYIFTFPFAGGDYSYRAPTVRTGRGGRPRRNITNDQLQFLISMDFTRRQIGEILGVSVGTVKNRLKYEEFPLSKHLLHFYYKRYTLLGWNYRLKKSYVNT